MPFLDESRWYDLNTGPSDRGSKTPAIFLDRDGVIIEEKHYISRPEQVEVLPGIPEKIAELRALKVPIIVITNQSGIGQGLLKWSDFDLIQARLMEILGMENPFSAVYANSHLSADNQADWRKPNPGMLLTAARDLNIDLESSLMVGDKWVDLEAANRAGVGHLAHVLTGHGNSERPKVLESFPRAVLLDSLADLIIEPVFPARISNSSDNR